MEFRAEIERGLIDPLLGHGGVQIQMITGRAATEAAIHFPPHMYGERAALRRLGAMDGTRAAQPRSGCGLRLEADQGQHLDHGDLLADRPEIDSWHARLRFSHYAEQEEESVSLSLRGRVPVLEVSKRVSNAGCRQADLRRPQVTFCNWQSSCPWATASHSQLPVGNRIPFPVARGQPHPILCNALNRCPSKRETPQSRK